MQFLPSCLAIPVGVNDKAMFAVELAAIDLKKQNLECIKHLAVFGTSNVSVFSMKIKVTALVCPIGFDGHVESHVRDQAGQKLSRVLTSFVHISTYDAPSFGFTFLAFAGTLSTTVVVGSFDLFSRLMSICWPKLTTFPNSQ